MTTKDKLGVPYGDVGFLATTAPEANPTPPLHHLESEHHTMPSFDLGADVDPFAQVSAPAISFRDAPIGTSYTGTVTKAPAMVQSRVFETGQPAFWPDGNPKMAVVTNLNVDGNDCSLWAPKPSSMFAAIVAAQQAAGVRIQPGGTLAVTYVGEKPNTTNPHLNAQKLYTVAYAPADMSLEPEPVAQPPYGGGYATPTPTPTQSAPPTPQQWQHTPSGQPVQAPQYVPAPAPQPQTPQYAPAQQAAPPAPQQPSPADQAARLRALGIAEDQIAQLVPGYIQGA